MADTLLLRRIDPPHPPYNLKTGQEDAGFVVVDEEGRRAFTLDTILEQLEANTPSS